MEAGLTHKNKLIKIKERLNKQLLVTHGLDKWVLLLSESILNP